MANEVNLVNGVGGVGRDVHAAAGTITVTPTSRNAANTLGSGRLATASPSTRTEINCSLPIRARAIWQATFDRDGNLKQDWLRYYLHSNTLCLDNVFVAHPYLEGATGIALDRDGNIWVPANERQAIVVVTKHRKVIEVFRNPVNSVGLRNSADPAVGNNHILEFPSQIFLTGKVLCVSQPDGGYRDNSSRRLGEVNASAVVDGPIPLGKISCMDQELKIPGLRLPIN